MEFNNVMKKKYIITFIAIFVFVMSLSCIQASARTISKKVSDKVLINTSYGYCTVRITAVYDGTYSDNKNKKERTFTKHKNT